MKRRRFLIVTAVWLLLMTVCSGTFSARADSENASEHTETQNKNTAAEISGYVELITYHMEEPDPTFWFCLEAVGDAPLPPRTQINVKGEGRFSFGKIRYSLPGDYHYLLFQKKEGREEEYQYDERIYEILVRVTWNKGGDLSAAACCMLQGTNSKKEPVFVNRLRAKEPEEGSEEEKDEKGAKEPETNEGYNSDKKGKGSRERETENKEAVHNSGSNGQISGRRAQQHAGTGSVQTSDRTPVLIFLNLFAGAGLVLTVLRPKKRKSMR